MKNLYLKNGNKWKVSNEDAIDIHDNLPAGVYTLVNVQFQGLMLEKSREFSFNGKVYGNTLDIKDRIWKTFMDKKGSMGVLLEGEKGSGKTLITKFLSMEGVRNNIATVIITSPFVGEEFNTLIQMLPDNTIVIFDEFEKVYSEQDRQNAILSLMDGIYNSKKLFLFTVNESSKVNKYMINRPGRLYYNIKFDGLSKEFIEEYATDNLKNKEYVDDVVACTEFICKMNFDMLQALIEEMNRYDEKPIKALNYLNITTEDIGARYEIVYGNVKDANITEFITKEYWMTIQEEMSVEIVVKTDKQTMQKERRYNDELQKYENVDVMKDEQLNLYLDFETYKGFDKKKGVHVFKCDEENNSYEFHFIKRQKKSIPIYSRSF